MQTAQQLILSNAGVRTAFQEWSAKKLPKWEFEELIEKLTVTVWREFARSVYATRLQKDHNIDVLAYSAVNNITSVPAKPVPLPQPETRNQQPETLPAIPYPVGHHPGQCVVCLKDPHALACTLPVCDTCERCREHCTCGAVEVVKVRLCNMGCGTALFIPGIHVCKECRDELARDELTRRETSAVRIPVAPPVVPTNPLMALIAEGLRDMGYVPEQAVSALECQRIAEDAALQVAEMVKEQLKAEGLGTVRHVVEVREAGVVREVEGRAPVWFGRLRKLAACRVPALLVGPPGSGKTTAFKMLAESMGLPFHRISIAAGTDEGQLQGWLLPVGEHMRFEYVGSMLSKAFEDQEHGGLVLIDDIDLGDANALGILNAVLDNGGWNIPLRHANPTFIKSPKFYLGAASNTWGHGADNRHSGANQLDERTLSRFRMGQIYCDYDAALERDLYGVTAAGLSCVEYGQMIRARIAACADSQRYLSTRDIEKADCLLEQFTLEEAWYGFFADWSAHELSQVHVVVDHVAMTAEVQ